LAVQDYIGEELDEHDLVREGSLGLSSALEGFDPKAGFKFGVDAEWTIRHFMLGALNTTLKYELSWRGRMDRILNKGEAEGVRPESGFDVEVVDSLKTSEVVEIRTTIRKLMKAESELTAQEYTVLAGRYGVLGDRPMTHDELAVQLRSSIGKIIETERRALEKFKPPAS
jgi:RNA polymerase sigma factor (sigma-70 family)